VPKVDSNIVEVCVFRQSSRGPQYLLLRRSPTERLYPDLWQIFTGKVVDGERVVEAAVREMREETGLEANRFWIVPYVSAFYDPAGDAVNLCSMFAAEVNQDREPLLSKEHQAFRWTGFEETLRTLPWPGQRDAIDIVQKYIIGGGETAGLTELKLVSTERNKP
jgi:dATP pyrophosphohydrolase